MEDLIEAINLLVKLRKQVALEESDESIKAWYTLNRAAEYLTKKLPIIKL